MTAVRRPGLAGAILLIVVAALVVAVVVGVTSDSGGGSPTLGGRPMMACSPGPACPEATGLEVAAGWRAQVALAATGAKVESFTSLTPTVCGGLARIQGNALFTALPAGRWRVVIAAGDRRYGAVLVSAGDPGPAVAPRLAWDQKAPLLSLTSDGGRPFDLTGTVWAVSGPSVTVTVDGGDIRRQPASLAVAAPDGGPVCQGRQTALALPGLARPAELTATVRLPDGGVLTATASYH